MTKSGRIQGTAKLRPWRLGVLIDTSSLEEVKSTVESLSYVWGGYFCPIFDRTAAEDKLVRLCAIHDVDSLYDNANDDGGTPLAQRPGYLWPAGFFEPFTSRAGKEHHGLLPTAALLRAAHDAEYVFPIWAADDSAAMIHTVNWGRSSDRDTDLPHCVSVAELSLLPVRATEFDHVGPVQASRFGIATFRREAEAYNGLWLVDPDNLTDLVNFWNMRAASAKVFAVSSSIDENIWSFLSASLREFTDEVTSVSGTRRQLAIYNLDIATSDTRSLLTDWATDRNIELVSHPTPKEKESVNWATRAETTTPFVRGFNSNFESGDHGVDVEIPDLPRHNPSRAHTYPGSVAVEVMVSIESHQHPNRTAKIPPYRQLSSLMRSLSGRRNVCHARVGPGGTAFLAQANEESIWYPFPLNLMVVSTLFNEMGDSLVGIDQSDVGRFHSRTAEIVGGHSSTAIQEPGVRAVLNLAASRPSGISSQQVRATILRERKEWPGLQTLPLSNVNDYAQERADLLFNSGLLVPFMDVNCNLCGVVTQIHPKDLDARIHCPYCGEYFQLALSLSLKKPSWRLKLAGHLPAQKIESAMPVLATLTTLSQLVIGGGGALCHALGVEMTFSGQKPVEMDIIAFVRDHGAPAVVGEVKTASKIDERDVGNVELVVNKLREVSVNSIPLFATLKERLSSDEIELIRDYCTRSAARAPLSYESIPSLPLVFVRDDMSLPWLHEQHPYQWPLPSYGQGIWGIALESCRRNIGLLSYNMTTRVGRGEFQLLWDR